MKAAVAATATTVKKDAVSALAGEMAAASPSAWALMVGVSWMISLSFPVVLAGSRTTLGPLAVTAAVAFAAAAVAAAVALAAAAVAPVAAAAAAAVALAAAPMMQTWCRRDSL